MKTIYKYPLNICDNQFVSMPEDSEILSVQLQGNKICLWALVEKNKPEENRHIIICGTGNELFINHESVEKFIGTVQQDNFVWHIFESKLIRDSNDK